jgi:hypothetical protein
LKKMFKILCNQKESDLIKLISATDKKKFK